jgi:hypothetical protein
MVPREQLELVTTLWARLGRGPTLFKEVEDLICSPVPASARRIEDITARLFNEQEYLKEWLILAGKYQCGSAYVGWRGWTHDAVGLMKNFNRGDIPLDQQMTWRVLQGSFLLCTLVKLRMLFALSPSGFPEMETTCQALAREILSMGLDPGKQENEKLIGGMFMSETLWMAKAVLDTRESWGETLAQRWSSGRPTGSGPIERWKFEAWCKAMGRKVRSPLFG